MQLSCTGGWMKAGEAGPQPCAGRACSSRCIAALRCALLIHPGHSRRSRRSRHSRRSVPPGTCPAAACAHRRPAARSAGWRYGATQLWWLSTRASPPAPAPAPAPPHGRSLPPPPLRMPATPLMAPTRLHAAPPQALDGLRRPAALQLLGAQRLRGGGWASVRGAEPVNACACASRGGPALETWRKSLFRAAPCAASQPSPGQPGPHHFHQRAVLLRGHRRRGKVKPAVRCRRGWSVWHQPALQTSRVAAACNPAGRLLPVHVVCGGAGQASKAETRGPAPDVPDGLLQAGLQALAAGRRRRGALRLLPRVVRGDVQGLRAQRVAAARQGGSVRVQCRQGCCEGRAMGLGRRRVAAARRGRSVRVWRRQGSCEGQWASGVGASRLQGRAAAAAAAAAAAGAL